MTKSTSLTTVGSGCTSPGRCRALAATANSGGPHNPHVTGYGSTKGGGGGHSSGSKGKGKGRRGWNNGSAQQRSGVG